MCWTVTATHKKTGKELTQLPGTNSGDLANFNNFAELHLAIWSQNPENKFRENFCLKKFLPSRLFFKESKNQVTKKLAEN